MSVTYNLGPVTAYAEAKEAGYTGTYEEFCNMLKTFAETSAQIAQELEEVRRIKTEIKNAFRGAVVTLTVASWDDGTNKQTVDCEGVDADISDVTVSPAPESMQAYLTAGVYLSALEDGKLTFFCSDKPTSDLTVNVEINNVRGISE